MFQRIIHLFSGLRVPRTGFLLISLLFVGCQSDPYEGVVLSPQKGEEPREVPPSYAMLIGEKNLLFSEGIERSYLYKFHVPEGGNPVVEIINPPEEGFRFDEAKSRIVWNPSFKAANNPFNTMEVKRHYPVTLRLKSSDENIVYRDFQLSVVVQDRPQNFFIEGADRLEIVENIPFHYPFRIVNGDFPNEVHRVVFPESSVDKILRPFTQQDPTDVLSWYIDMIIPVNFMRVNDNRLKQFFPGGSYYCASLEGCTLKHTLKMQVIAPNGQRVSKDIALVVKEQRNPPVVVSMMEDMAIQRNSIFYFRISDPNEEMTPFVSLVDEGYPHIIDYPQLGVNRFMEDNVFIELQSGGPFETVVLVHVKNIPDELVGEKLGMKFGTCNYDHMGDSRPSNTTYYTIDLAKEPEKINKCNHDPSDDAYSQGMTTCQVTEKVAMNSYTDYDSNKNCITVDVSIPIIDSKRPSPHFVRNQWPLNKTHYARMNQQEVIELPIYEKTPTEEESDGSLMVLSHQIFFFNEMQKDEVKWEDGKLIIDAKTLGDKSFAITAVNNVGEKEYALFSLKILPEDWSPVLLATGNLHGVEAQRLLGLLHLKPRDHWDITLNEDEFIDVNTRDFFALRDTLIIGSNALSQKNPIWPCSIVTAGISRTLLSPRLLSKSYLLDLMERWRRTGFTLMPVIKMFSLLTGLIMSPLMNWFLRLM